MGDRHTALNPEHVDFIGQQKMFFVATAGSEGSVNLSPKGMDSFRVLDATTIAWLNLTGSGNETATHLLEMPRMTIMFCSFDRQPQILRLYGTARTLHEGDTDWTERAGLFPDYAGTRQIFEMRVELVQESCGYAVPFYEFKEDRPTLGNWAEKKGREGVQQYWQDRNRVSLDGLDTDISA